MAIAASKHSKVLTKKEGSFAKGGTGHMFGKQDASERKANMTGGQTEKSGGKFAKGGSGHMFGKQSAGPKLPGFTGKKPGFSGNVKPK